MSTNFSKTFTRLLDSAIASLGGPTISNRRHPQVKEGGGDKAAGHKSPWTGFDGRDRIQSRVNEEVSLAAEANDRARARAARLDDLEAAFRKLHPGEPSLAAIYSASAAARAEGLRSQPARIGRNGKPYNMYQKDIERLERDGLSAREKIVVLERVLADHVTADPTVSGVAGTARPAPTPRPAAFDLAGLRALVDAVFGAGTSARVLAKPLEFKVTDPDRTEKALYSQAASEALCRERAAEAQRRHAEANSPAAKQAQFDELRQFLFNSGVTVPGLSFVGLEPGRSADRLDDRPLAMAQKAVDEFVAAFERTTAGARSPHPAARRAREFVRAQNGAYTVNS